MGIQLFAASVSLMLTMPTANKPAAMVLDISGSVLVTTVGAASHPISVGDLLYPADRLTVEAEGSATLAILAAGVKETIKSGALVTVNPQGCTPQKSVVRSTQRSGVSSVFKNLRPASSGGRKAGVTLRGAGDDPDHLPTVTPIYNATVASDRPTFIWQAKKDVTSYRVRLLSGAGHELWKSDTLVPRLDFPKDKFALQRGYVYTWEVNDLTGTRLFKAVFAVASDSEFKKLKELSPLAAGNDRADLLAAGMAFMNLGAYSEATLVYEKLTTAASNEPAYLEALASLYERAGRIEEARTVTDKLKMKRP